jgi:hypothetical protein
MRQKVEVRLVLVPGVSGVAVGSHRGGPSVRRYIAVSVEEACNPGLGDLNIGHCAYEMLDHLPCGRKMAEQFSSRSSRELELGIEGQRWFGLTQQR